MNLKIAGVSVLAAAMLAAGMGSAQAQPAKEKHSAKSAPAKKAPAAAGTPADPAGPFELQVWHSMNPVQTAEFDSLVQRFNAQNHGFTVVPTAKASPTALVDDATAAVRAKRPPNMVALPDERSPELIAQKGAVLPMNELLAKYPIKDVKWFLPTTVGPMTDAKGHLMALPWMAEIPLYYYNRDLYKKAGLNPDQPPKTWREMQSHLVSLLQSEASACPYASSWQTWIHVENMAAMHNKPYATKNNGLDGPNANGATLLANDLLHVRHLALMMSWVRATLFPVQTEHDEADAKFASGECAVLTSGSGAMAQIQANAKFSYAVAPLPFYDEEASRPSNPFVAGSAFWALSGHSASEQKALATFIAYLASPVVAAEWHQKTGFLPLTEAAYRASDVSYYRSVPGAQSVIAAMTGAPAQYTRGFRLNNYGRVSKIIDEELDAVWKGKPAKQGLDDAVARGDAIMGSAVASSAPAPKKAVAKKAVAKKAESKK